MTPQQIDLVQTSFRSVLLVSQPTADLFYARLFSIDPSLRRLFTGGMKQQGKMLMYALGTAVAWLKRFNAVVPSFEALAQRHLGYGVKAEHYDSVGEALIWSLERALGESFTDEVRSAWQAMYDDLSAIMKQAAYHRPGSCADHAGHRRPAGH